MISSAPKRKSSAVNQLTRQAEFDEKLSRIRGFLTRHGLNGIVFNGQNYFAWATGGGENYVVLGHDYGVGYLLVTHESVTVLANNIEIHRFTAEEFNGIDVSKIEFWSCPWHTDDQIAVEIRQRVGNGKWASDCGLPGSVPLPADFVQLTYALAPYEIERYRKLGKDCSVAMEEALEDVRPGMRETDIAALICRGMFDHNVRPQLALVAADHRVMQFRHAIPTQNKLKKHLMGVLCGKRGGLIINVTRMVYFGRKLPEELRRKHDAVCAIDVVLNSGTVAGRPVNAIFNEAVEEYRRQGFATEWQLHHQGGPTGYQGRSYRGTPTETRTVLANQAFAWNPSITGTKSEDTIMAATGEQGIEFLSSPTKRWPTLIVERNKSRYRRADFKLM
jgi:Xaa-Pro dipeptidase